MKRKTEDSSVPAWARSSQVDDRPEWSKPTTLKCMHDHLEFRDSGTRIACTNPTCGLTWFRETVPGSMMPFMGLVPLEERPYHGEKRSNPYVTQTYPLHMVSK